MNSLTGDDFTLATAPMPLFDAWFAEARASEPNDPNAMALATAGADGLPDIRMVLMKEHDARGFVFYTNSLSAKGRELAERMQAGALFHWKSLRRQVRARGPVEMVTAAEADAYFASRPRGSQIGAWASLQSQPLDARATLEEAVERYEAEFGAAPPPRPPHWKGYRIRPLQIEFWQDRRSRLHDRLVFRRADESLEWRRERLYP